MVQYLPFLAPLERVLSWTRDVMLIGLALVVLVGLVAFVWWYLRPNSATEEVAMAKRHLRFEVYRDAAGEPRWRCVHPNGRILCDSGEGYSRKRGLETSLRRMIEKIRRDEFVVLDKTRG